MQENTGGSDNINDFVKHLGDETPAFQKEALDTVLSDDRSPTESSSSPPSEESPNPAFDGPPLGLPLSEEGDADFPADELRDRVVIMLLFKQKVTSQQVAQAWEARKAHRDDGEDDRALWRFLIENPNINSEQVYAEAAGAYAFETINIPKEEAVGFIEGNRDRFSKREWQKMRELATVPVACEEINSANEKQFIFVTHDPTRKGLRQDIRRLSAERFELKYAPQSFVQTVIAEAFQRRNEYLERIDDGGMAHDFGASYDEDDSLVDQEALEDEISRSSLINLFEATLVEAVRDGASDIHIFPNDRQHVEIHFRKDGELYRWHVEKRGQPEAFFAVVKDNSQNVDRFERDDAQDGFIQRYIDDALIRFRVSVLPISSADQQHRAESIVIRVLDDRKVITDLDKLGLQEVALERFEEAISQPHGMVVLTGPTGSGKTTSLYAALHHVVTPKKNALTVEDPVEYILPGVRQLRLTHKLNVDRALRSILRHDPDIVMVGEMRDRPTAELAIKLANTGHLTFSTLHTNDAPSAVSRLYKMGVEPFLIANAINLVMAQRLVRVLCPACKREVAMPEESLLRRAGFTDADLADITFYGPGTSTKCKECGGRRYRGRRAITETLKFTDTIRHIILTAGEVVDEEAVRQKALEEGMRTLQDSARHLVKQGITSLDEMMRVTASQR